jgi:hypothetical protein
VDIFSKKMILILVHGDHHWSLAVVVNLCYMNSTLKLIFNLCQCYHSCDLTTDTKSHDDNNDNQVSNDNANHVIDNDNQGSNDDGYHVIAAYQDRGQDIVAEQFIPETNVDVNDAEEDVMKLTNDPALLEEMAALPTDVNVDSFILTQFSTEADVPQKRVRKKQSAAKGENVKAHQPKKDSGRKRTQAQRKEVSNYIDRDSSMNEEDPFINVAVAFSPKSDLCQQLIRGEWKKKWSTNAICYQLDEDVGHIVGRIIRKTKCTGWKKTQSVSYNVIWEYSSLGISEVPSKYVLDGNKVGEKLMEMRSNISQQASSINNRREMISRIRAERDASDDDDGVVPTFLDNSSANSISFPDDVEGSELEWCVLNGLDSNLSRSNVPEPKANGDEQDERFYWHQLVI